ncbi:AfsR/SARP family transcriptional regulator [Actinophytocola algeriensis]|uniref:DNA-binding SARP family transcriptional activator n=1 Tax=Actinophytocola algeriensis TaxID=1768010 RepID=A0A7W7Q380_9PSEU|nr:AfsR/SARP family transcriptional regulator [Actinophytocola algeriensis]MBB4906205.1 DNA-binding SARP family transcriptional activator [Actinophytocola algeriensis]MBE1472110.1 DNA-binding SARP family transcriptional activator [Actinophytocola algeriensis]
MNFEILGPLRVADGHVRVSASKHRTLLALLLCEHDHVVTVDQLVDEIWQENPPRSAVNLVRQYISHVRRKLGSSGASATSSRPELVTYSSGYSLDLRGSYLDRNVFEERVAVAQRAAARGETDSCVVAVTEALDLWRGPALIDVSCGPRTVAEARRLNGRRAFAEEMRIEAKLAVGRYAETVDELAALALVHPTRERLREHLMRTLYALGRRAEALEVYQEGRRALVDRLGIEPGTTLRRLEQEVLNDNLALRSRPRQELVSRPRRSAIPRQLPASHHDFIGRVRETEHLVDLLKPSVGGLPLVALSGLAGIGKTALALHVARRVRDSFPGGQMFARLSATDGPVPTANALLSFLRALGVSQSDVPPGLYQRAELFRGITADRQILVVLDDAGSESQVRALLPGPGASSVLVTSRRTLTGLDSAVHLTCGPLDADTGLAILGNLAGRQQLAQDPKSSSELVRWCRGLPVALCVIGAKLAAERGLTARTLLATLSGNGQLDELQLGELDVRARIASSHRRLGAAERDLLGRLAASARPVAGGDDLPQPLGELTPSDEALLEGLVANHMVEVLPSPGTGAGYFRLNYFVRLFIEQPRTGR